MKKQYIMAVLPTFIFMALVFFFWRGLSLDPAHVPSSRLDQKLPDFSLPRLGEEATLVSSTELVGKPIALHVFASWCSSCATEPVFLRHLKQAGVYLVGLNYKDTPEDATHWLTTWGNPYELILSDEQGRVGIDLGVYGTPETFFIDKEGIIRERYVGPITQDVWEQNLKSKWEQLQ